MLATICLGNGSGFQVEGDIDPVLIEWMRVRYGDRLSLCCEDEGGGYVNFQDLAWFKEIEIEPKLTPASNLRLYRELKKLTQKALADMIGETRQHISDMEHGRRPISLKMAKAISEALDAPITRFI